MEHGQRAEHHQPDHRARHIGGERYLRGHPGPPAHEEERGDDPQQPQRLHHRQYHREQVQRMAAHELPAVRGEPETDEIVEREGSPDGPLDVGAQPVHPRLAPGATIGTA
ncbi:hypothetical protein STANM309S_05316 [Streptomyces tanashiensis]